MRKRFMTLETMNESRGIFYKYAKGNHSELIHSAGVNIGDLFDYVVTPPRNWLRVIGGFFGLCGDEELWRGTISRISAFQIGEDDCEIFIQVTDANPVSN